MTVKEFKEILIENNIPDTANILVWADHGQDYEYADSFSVSKTKVDYDLDECIWEYEGYENDYDEEDIKSYRRLKTIKSICLYGE